MIGFVEAVAQRAELHALIDRLKDILDCAGPALSLSVR
jgi:hypothetical protein